jgi:hypothetical protein
MERRYLVDLVANHGRGKCDCKWGETHHGPLAKRNDPEADRTRCRHIKESRLKLADWLIKHLAGKGLLTYSDGQVAVNLESGVCNCGDGQCGHMQEAKEDLVSRYIQTVLKQHTNLYDQ